MSVDMSIVCRATENRPAFRAIRACNQSQRSAGPPDPTTWTAVQLDGLKHLELWSNHDCPLVSPASDRPSRAACSAHWPRPGPSGTSRWPSGGRHARQSFGEERQCFENKKSPPLLCGAAVQRTGRCGQSSLARRASPPAQIRAD